MDKKTLSKICLVCVLTMASGTAYGEAFTGSTVSGTSGTFSTSSNVTIDVVSTQSDYAAGSQHLQGDRQYFTNSSNPAFFYGSKAKGETSAIVTNATDPTPDNWSSL
jgi:hypothetical protein